MMALLATLALLLPNDTRLREKSERVANPKDEKEIFQAMLAFAEKEGDNLVGLAAPQLGVMKQVILIRHEDELKIYYNPKLLWRSSEETHIYEGCYSTGNVVGIVPRAESVRMRALGADGETLIEEFSGFTARVVQHEIDHLNGVRFPDRIANPLHLHYVEEKDRAKYHKEYETWKHICSRGEWNHIAGVR